MTSRTTAILIAVMIAETREETLVPIARISVIAPMMSRAPQSKLIEPMWAVVLPLAPMTLPRYSDQPLPTTAEARANSRMRSQPMIQAANSPNVA